MAFYKMLDPIGNSGVLEVSFTPKGKITNEYRFKFAQFFLFVCFA